MHAGVLRGVCRHSGGEYEDASAQLDYEGVQRYTRVCVWVQAERGGV